MAVNISKSLNNLLLEILSIAKGIAINRIAIVGGYVRDEILNEYSKESNQKYKDIDLLVEGSAIDLSEEIIFKLAQERIKDVHTFPLYNTVEMKIDGISFDFSSARNETYRLPGENPDIILSKIEEDLKRRDFSINAMAIELPNMNLLDPFNGSKDLRQKKLELLHPKSIADDPTRVIRGARYASRLNLNLTSKSLSQIQSTLKEWPWKVITSNSKNITQPALASRLKFEMNLLLNEEPWEKALSKLQSWGGLNLIDNDLQSDNEWEKRIIYATRLGIDPLIALIVKSKDPLSIAERLKIPRKDYILIKESLNLNKFLSSIDNNDCLAWKASKWCTEIEKITVKKDSVALSIAMRILHWEKLFRWWKDWRYIQSPITANKLLEDGWHSGIELGNELRRLRQREIDNTEKNLN